MKLNYYIRRGIRLVSLLWIKVTKGAEIQFVSRLRYYNVSCDTSIRVKNGGKMILCKFSTSANVHLSARGGILEIGYGCSFNRNDTIVSAENIHIGNGTVLGPNVCIYDHDHKFNKNGIIKGEYNTSRVYIGENVWIGAGVIILKGSTIGNNSIIGAGCVVNGNIPANMIVTAENRKLILSSLHD